MKLRNLKTWLPGMILGLSLLAVVPVSAGGTPRTAPPTHPTENPVPYQTTKPIPIQEDNHNLVS